MARSFSLPSFFFFLPPKMPRVTMPSGACGAYTCCGRSVGGGITRGFPDGPRTDGFLEGGGAIDGVTDPVSL